MNDFGLYLQMGFEHILDIHGIDHILFVTALCLQYSLKTWKQLLVAITAFTIGHSITLALSTTNIVTMPKHITELLIAISIVCMAFLNLFTRKGITYTPTQQRIAYGITLFFGLIHGLGFSTLLKSLLGQSASIWQPLLAFNIGLELGQIIIVSAVLSLIYLTVNVAKAPHKYIAGAINVVIALLALQMVTQRV
ncbi:MAG: HupE/UreJ family protein [Chitinophagaceae bacterium]